MYVCMYVSSLRHLMYIFVHYLDMHTYVWGFTDIYIYIIFIYLFIYLYAYIYAYMYTHTHSNIYLLLYMYV